MPARPLAALLCVVAVVLPRGAAAGEDVPAGAARLGAAEMRAAMHRYFDGERRGGMWLIGVGAPALGVGAGLAALESPFARGLGYALLGFGAIDVIGGATFFVNSRRRVPRFDHQIGADPAGYRAAELTRIGRVHREMRLLEAVEITLILAGAAMATVGALQGEELLSGVGTGVTLQSTVLLIYDQLAARRARRYDDALTRF